MFACVSYFISLWPIHFNFRVLSFMCNFSNLPFPFPLFSFHTSLSLLLLLIVPLSLAFSQTILLLTKFLKSFHSSLSNSFSLSLSSLFPSSTFPNQFLLTLFFFDHLPNLNAWPNLGQAPLFPLNL